MLHEYQTEKLVSLSLSGSFKLEDLKKLLVSTARKNSGSFPVFPSCGIGQDYFSDSEAVVDPAASSNIANKTITTRKKRKTIIPPTLVHGERLFFYQ